MGRAVVLACVPWLLWLAFAGVLLVVILRANRTKMELYRLRQLHRDEWGGAQSLSFVLALPFFITLVLFIVQVSQLMIGTIMIQYAAFAAARTAAVWIPAGLSGLEGPNRISSRSVDSNSLNQDLPSAGQASGDAGPTDGGVWYVIQPDSPKYNRITLAAAVACLPICPSRDVGIPLSGQAMTLAEIIKTAYRRLSPDSQTNTAIPRRIERKLAYALANTQVEMRLYHKNSEPPLVTHYLKEDLGEFYENEIGWQDQIMVTVRHNLALLPGPGRLLAQHVESSAGADDEVADTIQRRENLYTYPLSASAVIGNEGEKSVVSYVYQAY